MSVKLEMKFCLDLKYSRHKPDTVLNSQEPKGRLQKVFAGAGSLGILNGICFPLSAPPWRKATQNPLSSQ